MKWLLIFTNVSLIKQIFKIELKSIPVRFLIAVKSIRFFHWANFVIYLFFYLQPSFRRVLWWYWSSEYCFCKNLSNLKDHFIIVCQIYTTFHHHLQKIHIYTWYEYCDVVLCPSGFNLLKHFLSLRVVYGFVILTS